MELSMVGLPPLPREAKFIDQPIADERVRYCASRLTVAR
jgi:hypothetical protein